MESRYVLFLTIAAILALFSGIVGSQAAFAAEEPQGLVGRWDFDDGTGKDLSGNGNDAVLEGGTVYSLGKGRACIQLMEDDDPMRTCSRYTTRPNLSMRAGRIRSPMT